MESPKCQIYCVKPMSDGVINDAPKSPVDRLKVTLTRRLGPARKRAIKKRLEQVNRTVNRVSGRGQNAAPIASDIPSTPLQAGDHVRVKSRDEIESIVGLFDDLKGLTFMPEMWQYCGTEQRVFKPLTRFFDEREYQIRKAKGIVLLEGLMCQGTAMFGPCDRSCFYFWREEWLEKIE